MNKVYIAGGCDYNDSLMHYDVVGMKWGVRKANYRSNQIERFKNRASKYTDKAIEKKYEADAYHLKNDMNRSKRVAKKIKTFSNKSEFYKMEYKINKNKLYIETVAKKASTITPEQKQKGMAFVDEFLKEYEKKKG